MKKCIKRLISLCVFSVSIQSSLADDKCDIVGAGVLPYFFDDNGGINVLLGHQKGRGWSSFGGGPKKVESVNNPESRCEKHKEIALREGVEEMRYLISRELLSDLLTDAKSYPSHPKRNDFINYLIKVDKFSKDHYFSTVVLSNSGFTETSSVCWFKLEGKKLKISESQNKTCTPDSMDFYEIFWTGFSEMLSLHGETLF